MNGRFWREIMSFFMHCFAAIFLLPDSIIAAIANGTACICVILRPRIKYYAPVTDHP